MKLSKYYSNLIKAKNKCKTFIFREPKYWWYQKVYRKLDLKKVSQKFDLNTKNGFFFWPSISPMESMVKFVPQSSTMNWRRQMTQRCIKRSQNFSEENYRPISIVPNISKVYERRLYDQISNFFEVVFSKYQCGFLKGYSAQQCLLVMIENWKK